MSVSMLGVFAEVVTVGAFVEVGVTVFVVCIVVGPRVCPLSGLFPSTLEPLDFETVEPFTTVEDELTVFFVATVLPLVTVVV